VLIPASFTAHTAPSLLEPPHNTSLQHCAISNANIISADLQPNFIRIRSYEPLMI